MNDTFPHLERQNPGVQQLENWLRAEYEASHRALETETDPPAIYRHQGRVRLLSELLLTIDPVHRPYGSKD